ADSEGGAVRRRSALARVALAIMRHVGALAHHIGLAHHLAAATLRDWLAVWDHLGAGRDAILVPGFARCGDRTGAIRARQRDKGQRGHTAGETNTHTHTLTLDAGAR